MGYRITFKPRLVGLFSAVLVFLGAANIALAQSTETNQAILTEAREWLDKGQGKTAYQLLSPLETQMAGQPQFDYLLGLSALAVNEPSQAAFAFERCLAFEPRNGLCRLGMARAHLELAEQDSARAELDLVSQSSPPEPVQKAVADYMARLAGEEVVNRDSRLASYIRMGVGYDSNINTATSLGSMYVPIFGGEMTLRRDGRRRDSGFAQGRFHINYSHPFGNRWRLLAEGNIHAVGNFETKRYNRVVSDASIGLMYRHDKHQFSGKVIGQNYQLDSHSYRNLGGFLGQYVYSLTDRSQISVFGQASRLSYPGRRLLNANRYVGGASLSQALANDRAVVFVSAYGGNEKPVHSHAPSDTNYGFGGMRVGGMYMVTPRAQVEAGVGFERRRFKHRDLLFQRHRRETFYDAYLGLNYAINRKLSLRPRYQYTHSNSNIPLRDYQRHMISVNLQYDLF